MNLTLPPVCWRAVRGLLEQPGWASTPRDYYVAGNIDEKDRIPVSKSSDQPPDEELLLEVELTDREFDAIAKCLKFHAGRGALFANRWTKRLLDTFKVFESEED